MSVEKFPSEPFAPDDDDFALRPEDMENAGEYLGFASNGMTDNEKIDEYNYFDHYLDESSSDD